MYISRSQCSVEQHLDFYQRFDRCLIINWARQYDKKRPWFYSIIPPSIQNTCILTAIFSSVFFASCEELKRTWKQKTFLARRFYIKRYRGWTSFKGTDSAKISKMFKMRFFFGKDILSNLLFNLFTSRRRVCLFLSSRTVSVSRATA